MYGVAKPARTDSNYVTSDVCVCVYIYVCMFVCMYVGMYARMYACMYVLYHVILHHREHGSCTFKIILLVLFGAVIGVAVS